MKLAFLDKDSTFRNKKNNKLCEEQFKRPSIGYPDYIEAGEIMARFLRIDTNSINSIHNFFNFYINPFSKITINDELINKINTEQQYIKGFIEQYNNIPILYNKETVAIKRSDNLKESQDITLTQIRSANLASLTNNLNKKITNVSIGYTTTYKNKPSYYVNSDTTISKKKIEKAIDLQQYVIILEYASQDIFPLIWVEIANLIMNQRIIEKCQCCGNYYVKVGAYKTCMFCKSPLSRMKADELKKTNIDEYNRRKIIKTIDRYNQRNSNNKNAILKNLHKKLEENKDIPEIKEHIENLIKIYGGVNNGSN